MENLDSKHLIDNKNFSHKQLVLVTAPISIGAFFCQPYPNTCPNRVGQTIPPRKGSIGKIELIKLHPHPINRSCNKYQKRDFFGFILRPVCPENKPQHGKHDKDSPVDVFIVVGDRL